jgi:hypothetical protein
VCVCVCACSPDDLHHPSSRRRQSIRDLYTARQHAASYHIASRIVSSLLALVAALRSPLLPRAAAANSRRPAHASTACLCAHRLASDAHRALTASTLDTPAPSAQKKAAVSDGLRCGACTARLSRSALLAVERCRILCSIADENHFPFSTPRPSSKPSPP